MVARHSTYDCIVVGGGPSGSTVSTLLSQHGRRVLLLERQKFPRHHIGESLMPQTYWTFKRLGMLDKLKRSHFPRKESVQFVSAGGQESKPFYFADYDPNEWSTTWQVRRDEFDRMMLDNAIEHGVEVREGVRVKEVVFEEGRAVGVRAQHSSDKSGGTEGRQAPEWEDIRGRVVVDATGMAGILSRQLNLRYGDEQLKHAAIYAYYKNARVDTGRNAGATIVISIPNRRGWFWFIPLPNDVTSIGVVAPPSYLCTGRGDDPMATLEEEIANTPAMARRLEPATRVSGAYVTSDFSYRSKQMAGDGWLMVGDAFCFLDPLYSSGVMLALKSGELAADTIHQALEERDTSGERLGHYGPMFVHGVQMIRQLVYTFYDPTFSFSAFLKAHPQHADAIIRILIGDVFNDEVEAVFEILKDWTALPEAIEIQGSGAEAAVA